MPQNRHARRCLNQPCLGAKRAEVTLPVTFLGLSHPAESYVLFAACGRRAAFSIAESAMAGPQFAVVLC
jgi:hypothetical protein